ncbi:MAG: flippase-like domain-containing protein, partial [Cellulomonadaceae bacterium]|nr:flippase-like domain-containing protein [Cellulomonadaceae bacterium]
GSLLAHATQYTAGVRTERAYGPNLVAAIERAGWRPRALVRVADRGIESARLHSISEFVAYDGAPGETGSVLETSGSSGSTLSLPPSDLSLPSDPSPSSDLSQTETATNTAAIKTSSDSTATALARSAQTRIYAMIADDGSRYDVEMLDGDRQVPSVVQRLWRVVRLKGVGTRAEFSLKGATERTALMSFATTAAGVRTPRLLGMGMADDSAALVFEHLGAAVALRDISDDDLEGANGNSLMAEAWAQLLQAHAAGLAHHQLSPDVILVRGDQVWISGWEHGEIAASQLSKRLDLVQLLSLFALRVGPERALAGATQALPEPELAAIGPLLQTVALPAAMQSEVRAQRGLLPTLRKELAERLPETEGMSQAPQPLARFTPRTLIMLAITATAIVVAVTTVNFAQLQAAVTGANPRWVAIAFGFSMLTILGAALTLTSFTPNRIPLGKTVLAQLAGSFVALATPAGIGPAALNLRYLNRKGIPTSVGLAVVALMQTSQIVVTVVMLLVLSLSTGTGGLIMLPSATVLVALLLVLLVLVIMMLIPPVRAWVWSKIAPTLRQLWPRLSEMLSQPRRLALGLGGNLLMSFAYVMTFSGALHAFGYSMNLIDVAVIYLVGNTLGALIPTPGGLGGVEGALIAGLTAAGLPIVIATTVTLLFRLITYWARIPLGWLAMRALERHHEI